MTSHVSPRELNWLIVNSVLAAAAVGSAAMWLGRNVLLPNIPEAVVFGFSFFLIGIFTLPIASIESRRRRGVELRWSRYAFGSLVGALIGAAIYLVLA